MSKESKDCPTLLEQLGDLYASKGVKPYPVFSESTLRAWDMIIDPSMVRIQFPDMESHLHYKWRMFKEWVKGLPSRTRCKVFPYYIVRIEDYENELEKED